MVKKEKLIKMIKEFGKLAKNVDCSIVFGERKNDDKQKGNTKTIKSNKRKH
jgi:hypothetical protein